MLTLLPEKNFILFHVISTDHGVTINHVKQITWTAEINKPKLFIQENIKNIQNQPPKRF